MAKPVIFAVGKEFMEMDGLEDRVAEWEDGIRIGTDPGTFEWWYFDAHLDDGSTAVIVYATKPIISPGLPLTPNLSLTITRPNGTKTAEFSLPGVGEFQASKENCHVIIGTSRVGFSQTNGHWTYSLHAETESMSGDLIFQGEVPAWRPGAGKCYFGGLDHYFAWLPAIPHGSVSGTLFYDGQTHSVNGSGYHDHNWGNVSLSSVMDHWFWGRAHVGEYTLIFVEQIASRKYGWARMPVFLLAKGERVLADDAQYLSLKKGVDVNHAGGRQYPQQVEFNWVRGKEQVHLALRNQRIIEATSLLLALPPNKRRLARFFVNPYYFRFNTDLELLIDLDGLSDKKSGTALYEIMMLK